MGVGYVRKQRRCVQHVAVAEEGWSGYSIHCYAVVVECLARVFPFQTSKVIRSVHLSRDINRMPRPARPRDRSVPTKAIPRYICRPQCPHQHTSIYPDMAVVGQARDGGGMGTRWDWREGSDLWRLGAGEGKEVVEYK